MNTRTEPPDMNQLKALLSKSRYSEAATDPVRHHRRLARFLTEHDDPVWREIGQQLREGHMTMRDIVSVEAYREVFYEGLANNQEAFVSSLHAAAEYLEESIQDDEEPQNTELCRLWMLAPVPPSTREGFRLNA